MSPGVAKRERCWASLAAILMAVVHGVAWSCCVARLCREKLLLLVGIAQLLVHGIKLRSENRDGSHVSIPERMVSCRLLVHVRRQLAMLQILCRGHNLGSHGHPMVYACKVSCLIN